MSRVDAEWIREGWQGRGPIWSFSPGSGPVSRAATTLTTLLPLSPARFEHRLAQALSEASRNSIGFYLGGFSARRALASQLVIEIDPHRLKLRLKHRSPTSDRTVYLQDKFIGAGDWTTILHPLAASSTHRDVLEIVNKDFEYQRTDAYRFAIERSRGGKPVRRNFVALKSPQLVEKYFRQAADLCRSIRENGVRRRADCRSATGVFRNPTIRLPWVEWMEADIGLAIGPRGEIFHFGSGKHRTAAAQAFRLASIPGEVRMVHAGWLDRQIARTGLPPVDALREGIRALDRTSSQDR